MGQVTVNQELGWQSSKRCSHTIPSHPEPEKQSPCPMKVRPAPPSAEIVVCIQSKVSILLGRSHSSRVQVVDVEWGAGSWAVGGAIDYVAASPRC